MRRLRILRCAQATRWSAALAVVLAALVWIPSASALSIRAIAPADGTHVTLGDQLAFTWTGDVKGCLDAGPGFGQDASVHVEDEHGAGFAAGSLKGGRAVTPTDAAFLFADHGVLHWRLHAECSTKSGPNLQVYSSFRTLYIDQPGTKPNCSQFTFVSGDVRVNGQPAQHPTTIEGQPTVEYVDLKEGDTISTGSKTRVEIKLPDKSLIRLGPESKIKLTELLCGRRIEDRKVSMKLIVGNIWAKIAHALGGDKREPCHPVKSSTPAGTYVPGEGYYILVGDCEETGGGARGSIFEASYAGGQKRLRIRTDQDVSWIWGTVSGVHKSVKVPLGACSQVVPGAAPTTPKPCAPFFVWGGRRI